MKQFLQAILISISCLVVSASQAALFDAGGGMVYDSDQNLTWLQSANYCRLSNDPACLNAGMLVNGIAPSWHGANEWATNLVFGGFDEWRLPAGPQFDPTCQSANVAGTGISGGTGCSGSEMGYLFEVYGIQAGGDTIFGDDVGPFKGLMGTLFGNQQWYWSGTESLDGTFASVYRFNLGSTGVRDKSWTGDTFAWAVHEGNIGGAVVPVPAAVWLFGTALIGLVGYSRRRCS